ncbi:uncharacterized protein LOC134210234 [Armigeres subalbatus]|uniref:uncharacterized protein LOC134210234 n=1 Tax=Armigeres subalbatus TaxID=124917 RepID=UPI002ED66801
MELRKDPVWLVGRPISAVEESKLPSNREALQLYFYYNKNGRKYAARKACNMISDVWKTFGIPTRRSDYPLKMLLQLHDKWIGLRKSKWRDEEVHIQQPTNFDLILNELFDIGQKGNSVHTAAVNNIPDKPAVFNNSAAVFNNSAFERNFDMSYLDNIETDPDFEVPEKKKMKTCVSQDLSMALDRGGISNAKATMIIAAMVFSLGHPIEELNLSVSTIRRARMKIRKCVANEMKASFSSDDYWVVHWDGKLLPDLTDGGSGQLVDRLPVIISGKVTEQLLGAPKIEAGTGASQAEAVYKCLVDWGVQDNVVGKCFVTTSSNTGHKAGACTLVERKLGRPLMNLACRHHVLELVLKAAFEDQFGTSTSPQIPMFEKFRREWHALNHSEHSSIEFSRNQAKLISNRQETISFCKMQLKNFLPRDDYKELLQYVQLRYSNKFIQKTRTSTQS